MKPSINTIITTNPFHAAYLLHFGDLYRVDEACGSPFQYELIGRNLLSEDLRYRSGNALINPVLLKEIFSLLIKLSFKTLMSGEARDEDYIQLGFEFLFNYFEIN